MHVLYIWIRVCAWLCSHAKLIDAFSLGVSGWFYLFLDMISLPTQSMFSFALEGDLHPTFHLRKSTHFYANCKGIMCGVVSRVCFFFNILECACMCFNAKRAPRGAQRQSWVLWDLTPPLS